MEDRLFVFIIISLLCISMFVLFVLIAQLKKVLRLKIKELKYDIEKIGIRIDESEALINNLYTKRYNIKSISKSNPAVIEEMLKQYEKKEN